MITSLKIALILAFGIGAQWIAWRWKLPAIVLLLAFGVGMGFVLPADQLVTDVNLLFSLVSLSVGLILFEGGLSLDFREIQETRGVVLRLVTLGLITTWLLTSALAHWVAGFSIEAAVLLGALLTVSGPTVVLPLLRHVQPVRRIGSLTKWEGIVNDPIGAVLAALVFEVVVHPNVGDQFVAEALRQLGTTVLVGIVMGGIGALFVQQMLKRHWAPDYLENPVILSLVLLTYTMSNQLQHESGLVTVTLMGLILANQRSVDIRHVVEFKENLRVLLISMLFVVLASRLDLQWSALSELGWRSVAFVALLILAVRPLSVMISTIGSSLTRKERIFLAWIHPRGIVAAAVSSLLALQIKRRLGSVDPLSALAADAPRFELTVFLVIIGTVAVYGLTLAPLARRLGLSGANPQGVLFVGASLAVREIAQAIQEEKLAVLLVDTNHHNSRLARMAGLPVSRASIGSAFIQEEIDLGGIGRLLAMTPNDEVNSLAAISFAERFGRSEVYQLALTSKEKGGSEKQNAFRGGRPLFDGSTTLEDLESRLRQGARIKKTTLTADFTYGDFQARYGETALVLFRIDEGGRLQVATPENGGSPKPGQKLLALIDS